MLGILSIVLLSACTTQIEPKQTTCNKPYILVGNNCCLDKDDNSICDKDEQQKIETPEVKETPKAEPVIETKEAEETKTLTIEDLQADMGNVIRDIVILTKDSELDYAQVYSNKVSNVHLLGKYGQKPYSKIITKKRQKVVQITDSKNYLNDDDDFQNFVKKNKDMFIESALNSKGLFEYEFKEGGLLKVIWLKKTNNKDTRGAERAKYVSHSELSSVLFYDNITFPETVSENLAEINYVRVNKYEINITTDIIRGGESLKYTEKLSNINYGQSIVMRCSPNLVIGLSFEDYGDSSLATYERNYDRNDVTSGFFLTPIRDHYQELIRDAQALVKMCEQRYEFTYVRER